MKKKDKSEIIVGLDIGTTKICAVVGERRAHEKLHVLGVGMTPSTGVMQGVVHNLEKTTTAITKTIKAAQDSAHIDIGVVNVGIASQHVQCHSYPNMVERTQPEEMIKQFEVDDLTNRMYAIAVKPDSEIVHIVPQDYCVDGQSDVDPVGMIGRRLEANFNLITARTRDISNLFKCVEQSNLDCRRLILEPLASSLSVLSEEEKEAGVVLVDIGGGTTDVAIFHEGAMRHTAVIPFGGNSITQDIKEGCNLLESDAETLKIKDGIAIAERAENNACTSIAHPASSTPKEISLYNLASIIQARLEEIIGMVYAEMRAFNYLKKIAAGIVLTGGGSQMRAIRQLVEYKTGYRTRIGLPGEHLVGTQAEKLKSPMYATAVGLVLGDFHPKSPQWTIKRLKSNHPDKGKKGKGWSGFSSIADWTKTQLTDDISELE